MYIVSFGVYTGDATLFDLTEAARLGRAGLPIVINSNKAM